MSRLLNATIIKDASSPTGVRVVYIPHGSQHNMQLRPAPPGFVPGDERFMKLEGQNLSIDLLSHQKELGERHKVISETQNWNSSSPIQRFKNKIK